MHSHRNDKTKHEFSWIEFFRSRFALSVPICYALTLATAHEGTTHSGPLCWDSFYLNFQQDSNKISGLESNEEIKC